VGVTHDKPEKRYASHISNAKNGKFHSSKWVNSLLKIGLRPILSVIEMGVGDRWGEVETFWIAWYREQGANLTNHADGGRGPIGCKRTPETRARIRAANLGKKQSPELVEKRIAPLRGRPLTPEAVEKIKAGMRGRKLSVEGHAAIVLARARNPEWNSRISASNKLSYERRKSLGLVINPKGRKPTDETRSKLISSHLGKKQSEATKAKHSKAMRLVWAKRKLQAGVIE